MITPIPVTIPTVPGREGSLNGVLTSLKGHPWALPAVSMHVSQHTFISRAIDCAFQQRADAPWFLWLEDDVVLGPDFGIIPSVLESIKDPALGAVSFFRLKDDFADGLTKVPTRTIFMTQCWALRRFGVAHFALFEAKFWADHPEMLLPTDIILREYLAAKRRTVSVWAPSLVQHLDLPSAAGNSRSRFRQSKSFERVYGDLNAIQARTG